MEELVCCAICLGKLDKRSICMHINGNVNNTYHYHCCLWYIITKGLDGHSSVLDPLTRKKVEGMTLMIQGKEFRLCFDRGNRNTIVQPSEDVGSGEGKHHLHRKKKRKKVEKKSTSMQEYQYVNQVSGVIINIPNKIDKSLYKIINQTSHLQQRSKRVLSMRKIWYPFSDRYNPNKIFHFQAEDKTKWKNIIESYMDDTNDDEDVKLRYSVIRGVAKTLHGIKILGEFKLSKVNERFVIDVGRTYIAIQNPAYTAIVFTSPTDCSSLSSSRDDVDDKRISSYRLMSWVRTFRDNECILISASVQRKRNNIIAHLFDRICFESKCRFGLECRDTENIVENLMNRTRQFATSEFGKSSIICEPPCDKPGTLALILCNLLLYKPSLSFRNCYNLNKKCTSTSSHLVEEEDKTENVRWAMTSYVVQNHALSGSMSSLSCVMRESKNAEVEFFAREDYSTFHNCANYSSSEEDESDSHVLLNPTYSQQENPFRDNMPEILFTSILSAEQFRNVYRRPNAESSLTNHLHQNYCEIKTDISLKNRGKNYFNVKDVVKLLSVVSKEIKEAENAFDREMKDADATESEEEDIDFVIMDHGSAIDGPEPEGESNSNHGSVNDTNETTPSSSSSTNVFDKFKVTQNGQDFCKQMVIATIVSLHFQRYKNVCDFMRTFS